jgi:uncharacterized protein (DUF2237 family)
MRALRVFFFEERRLGGIRLAIEAEPIQAFDCQSNPPKPPMRTNVLATALTCCCRQPMTGFYRDGYCRTGPGDVGLHTVCVEVTAEFLRFSAARGNDLSTPAPEWDFPGLKPGDRWCLCVSRWKEALDAGVAPPVCLSASHESALEWVDLNDLKAHALDDPGAVTE